MLMELVALIAAKATPNVSPDPVTTIDIVNLVLALIGVIGATVALVWRFVEWRLTGSVVKVNLNHATLLMNDGTVGANKAVSITAQNVGRTSVSVTGWGLEIDPQETIVMFQAEPWMGPALPYTLEPGHEASWLMFKAGVRERLATLSRGPATPLRGFVNLGTGKRARSKRALSGNDWNE